MTFPAAASSDLDQIRSVVPVPAMLRWAPVATAALLLAGCAAQPLVASAGPGNGRYFDPILGVWASPRLVADGQPVPRGGGGYLVGRPYTIGGRTFVPNANPQGYAVVGTASWYGDAFHGRRTANGEIFDKGSISAAHPTLPLPSYVRVTNLKNSRSMIVRVNDRGPYHGGRVMDVSQRVAEALAFRNEGTAQIRVEYVGRASLGGSDDGKLLASLRVDGGAARLDGMGDAVQVAEAAPPPLPDAPAPLPILPRVTTPPIFRRGHVVTRTAEITPPAEALSPPPPAPLPLGRSALRRAARGRDPFYRSLFPAPQPEPRPGISFAAPPRRSPRTPGGGTEAATGEADTR